MTPNSLERVKERTQTSTNTATTPPIDLSLELLRVVSAVIDKPARRLAQSLRSLADEGKHLDIIEGAQGDLAVLTRLSSKLNKLLNPIIAPTTEPTSVTAALDRAVTRANLSARLAGVEVAVVGPDGAEPPRLSATQLDEVLSELITNTLQFTPKRGRIELSSRRGPDGGAIVEVRGAEKAPCPRPPDLGLVAALVACEAAGGEITPMPWGCLLHLPGQL